MPRLQPCGDRLTSLSVGDTIDLDVTSIVNAAINTGDPALGISLLLDPLIEENEAIVFEQFRLVVD